MPGRTLLLTARLFLISLRNGFNADDPPSCEYSSCLARKESQGAAQIEGSGTGKKLGPFWLSHTRSHVRPTRSFD